MSRRKKRRKDEEHMSEAWLLPYADLLTLLLALFIVLFAISSVDAQRFSHLSQVFSGIFMNGTGPVEFQQPVEDSEQSADVPSDWDAYNKAEKEAAEKAIQEMEKELEILEAIREKVESFIQKNGYEDKFSTSLTAEGLLIRINDSVLFQSGSDTVREEDKNTGRELAKLLEMEVPRSVIISGHTDNVPIKNSNFQSNWELSVMRAVNFMKVLLENENLDPQLFSAKGFGEFQPIADNNTAEGREKNRRVEVLIQPYTEETQ
ncbi:flagellar motor protein MotB [Siminovitchia sp. FSL H7-0308]|uniref:Chemotaxis protein MotB n=1 Tax=Siminovitchia thermophila TaxID=1245522 RepID=A0ABS2RBN7_9BACI|nr:flagellar motor protein MotB [Siminovitchia thermophila]MBM7717067.1 chemotaxis protein MotB [Siminovitchia thermophila]ONK25138.1 flagellar motor protein MotB [Bacillus sp. VT-16-64]